MNFITEKDRIFAEDQSGKLLAEISFPTKHNVSIINHTFVDDSLRGQGIAAKLVKMAAEVILESGNKIAATCPYAIGWFKKHPEYKVKLIESTQH